MLTRFKMAISLKGERPRPHSNPKNHLVIQQHPILQILKLSFAQNEMKRRLSDLNIVGDSSPHCRSQNDKTGMPHSSRW